MENAPAPQTVPDVINLWKTAEELAAEIGEKGVTVRQWRNREIIPPARYPAIVRAAEARAEGDKRFAGVTYECLVEIAERAAAAKAKQREGEAA
jgi:hypothetical protein